MKQQEDRIPIIKLDNEEESGEDDCFTLQKIQSVTG